MKEEYTTKDIIMWSIICIACIIVGFKIGRGF